MKPIITILCIGDIVGQPGVNSLQKYLPEIFQKYEVDFCIANGENSHEGKGLNETILKAIYRCGVDVITGGDHSFDKHLIYSYMNSSTNLLRPANFPEGVPGYGFRVFENNGIKIGIINLMGRTFVKTVDCPFRKAEQILEKMQKETSVIMVDFHAEATAEKSAFAWYMDGKVSAIAGTHSHVQTADEQILPKGTGFITDIGMTGSFDSVIGLEKEIAFRKFILQMPAKHILAEGDLKINGVVFSIDTQTGKTVKIQRVLYPAFRN